MVPNSKGYTIYNQSLKNENKKKKEKKLTKKENTTKQQKEVIFFRIKYNASHISPLYAGSKAHFPSRINLRCLYT